MKKWISFAVLALIILAGVLAFYILSQPPKDKLSEEFKKAALSKLLGRSVNLTDDTPKGLALYDGSKILFSYPAKAVPYDYQKVKSEKSGDLDSFSFDIKDPKLVFNLTVKATGAKTLSDIPAVRLREERGYEYKKNQSTMDGISGVVYFKTGRNPEASAFYLRDGNVYTISITGSQAEEINKLFSSVVSSAKFK